MGEREGYGGGPDVRGGGEGWRLGTLRWEHLEWEGTGFSSEVIGRSSLTGTGWKS